MKIVFDIEANSLKNPTKIWLIVCKDIDTLKTKIFRNVHDKPSDFLDYSRQVTHWIGHNILEYDLPVLHSVIGLDLPNPTDTTDTLIVSRLVNYSRPQGHSLASYGLEFDLEKYDFNDWTQWSQEMEKYCVRDVEINHRVYLLYQRILDDPAWSASVQMEHNFQVVVNSLHNNGFCFDANRGNVLLSKVTGELAALDVEILEKFLPKCKYPSNIKERSIRPTRTKHGTLNRKDFRWIKDGNISDFNGGPFCKCSWTDFNPSSPKQIIKVLWEAGWSPTDKTQTHKDTEREINRLKHRSGPDKDLTLPILQAKLLKLGNTGWKVNENNLSTLPPTAPTPARTLAKRILYESRRRTLTEWLGLVTSDNRIHGKFVGIGAWTHRMAHQQPNTANIPNATKEDGSVKLLGKELRSLWRAPKNRLLVGVDAEGIQFRLFAHYVNSKELTQSLVAGKKSDKSDPHSLNARIIGNGCARQQAKRYIYALLLGAGSSKLAEILGCTREEGEEALSRILERYPGFDQLRREQIPRDAKRGYFEGLDGREVRIPGDTVGERRHLCMSGYLQNGEAIIMKMATLKWMEKLHEYDALLVNFVHDEWQVECPNDIAICLSVAELMANSLREVGEELKLNCPMAGSYYNEDIKDYTIGTNWYQTH